MKKKVLILLCVFSCCNLVGCNVDSELLFGSEAQQETEKVTPETATEASTEYYESLTFRSKLGKRIKDNIEEHSPGKLPIQKLIKWLCILPGRILKIHFL